MKGGNETRKGKGWNESIIGRSLLFEHMDIATVSLGPPKVSLISPLACMQLCIPQLSKTSDVDILHNLRLHSVECTFHTRALPPSVSGL